MKQSGMGSSGMEWGNEWQGSGSEQKEEASHMVEFISLYIFCIALNVDIRFPAWRIKSYQSMKMKRSLSNM